MPHVNLSVDDFLSACYSSDIEELMEALIEDGHLKEYQKIPKLNKTSYSEEEFIKACNKISESYFRLSNQDCDLILGLAKKL